MQSKRARSARKRPAGGNKPGSTAARKAPPRRITPVGEPEAPATRARSSRHAAPGEAVLLTGACHCGAIQYTLATAVPPARWPVALCQCSFCRSHNARMTADPDGEARFDFRHPEFLRRYRFGLRTADYLVCRECGVFVAAVMITGHGALASINVNTLHEPPSAVPAGKPVQHDGESAEARRARRSKLWTPVAGPV